MAPSVGIVIGEDSHTRVSLAVKSLATLVPSFPSTRDEPMFDEMWEALREACAGNAALVVLLGAMVGVATSLWLCCCRHKADGAFGPSTKRPMLFLVVTMAMAYACIFLYSGVGTCIGSLTARLASAARELWDGAQEVSEISSLIATSMVRLRTALADCDPALSQRLRAPMGELDGEIADDVASYTAGISAGLLHFQRLLEHIVDEVLFDAGLRLLLVLTCCSIMFYLLLVAQGGRRSATCAWGFRVRAFLFLLVGPTVVMVSSRAAKELGYSFAIASFCDGDVDLKVLQGSWHFLDDFSYNVSRHYLVGDGSVAVLDALRSRSRTLNDTTAIFVESRDLSRKSCADVSIIDQVALHFDDARRRIDALRAAWSPAAVRQSYRQMVHEDVCHTLIETLVGLVACQLFVAVFLLPLAARTAAKFLDTWPGSTSLSRDLP